MWNKGLSYRERHGLGPVGMNKDTNSNESTLNKLRTDLNNEYSAMGYISTSFK